MRYLLLIGALLCTMANASARDWQYKHRVIQGELQQVRGATVFIRKSTGSVFIGQMSDFSLDDRLYIDHYLKAKSNPPARPPAHVNPTAPETSAPPAAGYAPPAEPAATTGDTTQSPATPNRPIGGPGSSGSFWGDESSPQSRDPKLAPDAQSYSSFNLNGDTAPSPTTAPSRPGVVTLNLPNSRKAWELWNGGPTVMDAIGFLIELGVFGSVGACILLIAAKICRVKDANFFNAFLATLVIGVGGGLGRLALRHVVQGPVAPIAGAALAGLVGWGVITSAFNLSPSKGCLVAVVNYLVIGCFFGLMFLVAGALMGRLFG